MKEDVPAAVRVHVQERARGRCEYCGLHEEDGWEPHQPDHIIARKHRGETVAENLAWTCALCNRHKGSDVASVDPVEILVENGTTSSSKTEPLRV